MSIACYARNELIIDRKPKAGRSSMSGMSPSGRNMKQGRVFIDGDANDYPASGPAHWPRIARDRGNRG